MARGPDAFFCGFTGIINHRFFDQSDHAYYLSYFINWYKRCKGLLLFRFLIFIPSIILIRTFVFVNFVLCSLFFFRNFPNILLSVWELWISKKHNIYTSHCHEITKNLHAPFTWKVEVHFVTSNTEWLNIVHLSKNVVFTEGKEKATIYQKRWSRFWSLWHHNNYLYPFWKFLLLS